jgi:hypothetical protein
MRICFASLVILLLPAGAHAQGSPCAPRAAVGAALGFLTLDTPVDPMLAGVGRNGLASTTGTGLEGSVHAIVPISDEWAVTAEAGRGRMAVVLDRDADGNDVNQRTGDDVLFQRFVGGLRKTNTGYRSCIYAGVRVGLYRYTYQGVSLNAGGGAAFMGSDIPLSEHSALFFEIELGVAVTKARPPLTPAGVVPSLRPAFGFRYRF